MGNTVSFNRPDGKSVNGYLADLRRQFDHFRAASTRGLRRLRLGGSSGGTMRRVGLRVEPLNRIELVSR